MMVHFFWKPDRRQLHLLPVDMMEWVPEDDIVHLILDVVEGMDLCRFEIRYDVPGTGKPAYAPSMMLSVLIYAYAHSYRSSRKIESLCTRDAGFRMIVGEHLPDHATIARFRRRHVDDMQGLVHPGLEAVPRGWPGQAGGVDPGWDEDQGQRLSGRQPNAAGH